MRIKTPLQEVIYQLPYMFRHEIYKTWRQIFYRLIVFGPLGLVIVLVIVQQVLRLTDPPPAGIPGSAYPVDPHNLGYQGSFAIANQVIFANLGMLFNIFIVIACALSVANEYRWNTIKFLALREANRITVALSKCILAAGIIICVYFSCVLGWLAYGLSVKTYYGTPLELSAVDWENIGKGLVFFLVICLQTLIMSLFAMVLSFQFKSVVAGIIGYLAFVGIDSTLSPVATGVINLGYGDATGLVRNLLGLVGFINPVLLTSNVNRLTMVEAYVAPHSSNSNLAPNTLMVTSTPVWWSWLILLAYILLFTGLTIVIFVRRDIND